ncbi:MAG: protein adenylyltransferase SelO, partial [Bacteroidota bacterium]
MSGWNIDNSYSNLPERLFSHVHPQQIDNPSLVLYNQALGNELGLKISRESNEILAELFSGKKLPPNSKPIAQAYAGHQFGHFNMLGDGRALLIGEQITPDNKRYDIQLKGSGLTPYSRRGDGQATLSAMLREYLYSEAMHGLGIATTRSLAVVKTGEEVVRQELHEGAILTRVASSHIRVGTFEYAAHLQGKDTLRALFDYTIERHYPHLKEKENPALALLTEVMQRQIALITEWMRVGFIHGVMNTDNMSIACETIDYGPCAFMNTYHPDTVFSSIDTKGRYAYGNQPAIAHWNIGCLASALLELIDDNQDTAVEKAKALLQTFPELFRKEWYQILGRKTGLIDPDDTEKRMIDELLEIMKIHQADYT